MQHTTPSNHHSTHGPTSEHAPKSASSSHTSKPHSQQHGHSSKKHGHTHAPSRGNKKSAHLIVSVLGIFLIVGAVGLAALQYWRQSNLTTDESALFSQNRSTPEYAQPAAVEELHDTLSTQKGRVNTIVQEVLEPGKRYLFLIGDTPREAWVTDITIVSRSTLETTENGTAMRRQQLAPNEPFSLEAGDRVFATYIMPRGAVGETLILEELSLLP